MKFLLFLCLTVVYCHISPKKLETKKIIIHKDYGSSSSSSSSSSEEFRGPRRHRPRGPRGPRPSPKPSKPKGCPADWMTFERPQGKWCVKVFYGPSSQPQAQSQCQAQQATLTGIQDANERAQIVASARQVVNQNGGGNADIWLGASRKPNCPVKQSCAPMDTFEWTDGSTTGIAGFKWGGSEPNGMIFPNAYDSRNWGQQNCVTMLVNGNGDRTAWGYWNGDMDDVHCVNPEPRMYVCGKRAD